ncbi:MAG: hypothetical protein IPM97_15025 [Bdellovibrionaceae bacterium]|nr:hypothetical protein [Pseudobdellovibrionaceae bacterium]
MKWKAILGVLISTNLVGCNYTKIKDPSFMGDNSQFSLPAEQRSNLSYAYVNRNVLTPKCISCHGTSGRVSLESYQSVFGQISGVKKSVFETLTMPKNRKLTEVEMSILWTWIEMGAPEQAPGGENPGEDPIPLEATFESIDKHILQIKCLDCHSATGSVKRILLGKEDLLNSPLELVIPGNADESGLIISLERSDDKLMPPSKEGYSPVKPEEIKIIREWINNGAN